MNITETKMTSETFNEKIISLTNIISCHSTASTGSHINLNKRSSILGSCRICLSKIVNPASLVCGHTFCEKCLDQYWQASDMPESIVCPLCRKSASKVCFAKKEQVTSTEDFRKNFNMGEIVDEAKSFTTFMFLKLSLVIPALYCIINWLKTPFLELVSLLMLKLGHKVYENIKN